MPETFTSADEARARWGSMRLISFAITTKQVRERTKTVTRRLAWEGLKPGTLLLGVEKAMGLKKGEKVKPRYEVRATECRRCSVCRGCTHHWLEGFDEDEDGEMVVPDDPRWTCKHCEFSMPYDDEDPEAQYRQMRELGLVLPAEAADHYTGLDALSHATAIARMSPCKKSKRGVLVFNRRGPLGGGFNGPPPGFICDGSQECRAACPKVCNHAEARALLEALSFARRSPTEPLDIVLHGAELLHIKVVDGEPVPSGPPSCWQCSRLILDCGISKVWLVHADGLKSYTADEFHEATLRECGLPVIREAAHG